MVADVQESKGDNSHLDSIYLKDDPERTEEVESIAEVSAIDQ